MRAQCESNLAVVVVVVSRQAPFEQVHAPHAGDRDAEA